MLNIALSLTGFGLLRFQVGLDRQVWLRLTIGIGFGISRGTRGNAVLALIFRELPETLADLGPEVVVHVLKVRNGDGDLRTSDAVIPLAGGHDHLDALVGVWRVLDSRKDDAGAQGTFRSIGHGFTEHRGDQERPKRRIQRGRNLIWTGLPRRRWGAADRGGGRRRPWR